MLSKNIEVFMGCDWEPEEAETILFGAPFDSTTSYRPGTRFGSGAIRQEAYGLEDYSPYQDKDLSQVRTGGHRGSGAVHRGHGEGAGAD